MNKDSPSDAVRTVLWIRREWPEEGLFFYVSVRKLIDINLDFADDCDISITMGKNAIEPEKTTSCVVHKYCRTHRSLSQPRGIISFECDKVNSFGREDLIAEVRKDFPDMDLSEAKIAMHGIEGLPGSMYVEFEIEKEVPPSYIEIGIA